MKILLFFFLSITVMTAQTKSISFIEPSLEELNLIKLINQYRATKKLPPIKISKSLSHVAQLHAKDMAQYPAKGKCIAHSWSPNGNWKPCCYTIDHRQAQCMWEKPREITNFKGNGYENAAMGVNTAFEALQLWKSDAPHNDVIVNQSIWKRYKWKSLGVCLYQGQACMWLSDEDDPDGYWE
jgi:hypothetical protein